VLRDASIIYFAAIDWKFSQQLPQELALRLAEAGNRVLYIENTGARAIRWRDLPRLWLRLRNWLRARGGTADAGQGVDIFSPVLLPFPASPLAAPFNSAAILRVVRRWLRRKPASIRVLITYLPTPAIRRVSRSLKPDVVVYFLADRMTESSPGAARLVVTERQLVAEADLVVTTSSELYNDVQATARRAEIVECGVRCELFAQARRRRHEPHAAFRGIDGPVAGFVGSFRDATDLVLLEEAARLAPDITFVLAGPRFADVRALAARPNVRLTGPISHAEVAEYVARFDVGLLPYVLDRFTAGILPVKMKEYLAAGVPVVSTALPSVLSFAERHDGCIRFASTPEEFVSAMRQEIAADSAARADRRLQLAQAFDWSKQASLLSSLIEDVIARRSAKLS
jgi:glycosyltransferase involved in cell wall biosynthesis